MSELLVVGRITKVHGLKGEVIVDLLTDRLERLDVGSVLESDRGPLTVASAHRHQQRWRVRFDGFARREDVEGLPGFELRAAPLDDDDLLFVHELIDRPVIAADGSRIGQCVAVVDNPAHELLELDSGALVPLPFVTGVDDEGIHIDPPDGLFEAQV